MRKMIAMLLAVGIAGAVKMAEVGKDKIDKGIPPVLKGGVPLSNPLSINIVYKDSAVNQYSFWTQMQDPVYVNGDTIILCWRGYEVDGSGYIAEAMSTDGGNTFTVCRRINEVAGVFDMGGRYPSAHSAKGYPTAHFPELTAGPAWGWPVSLTGDWNDCTMWFGDAHDPGVQAHKVIPARLPDGTVLVAIASAATGQAFQYAIYHPDFGAYLQTPTLVNADFRLYGVDEFGGNVYVFGWDPVGGAVSYFVYDYNSGSWSGPTPLSSIPIIVLPNGEVLNTIMWIDGVVLNDGTPVAICDLGDGAGVDTTAPYLTRVIFFVTPTSIETLVVPDVAPEAHYYYPQLSIDRNTGAVAAFWEKVDTWMNDTITGWATYDIWATYSLDNGATWSTPVNLTGTTGENECMFQVGKRMNNGIAWIAYMKGMPTPFHPDIDLYWVVASDFAGGVWGSYVYLGWATVGVEERTKVNGVSGLNVFVEGNTIKLVMPSKGKVNLSIYDIMGRKVASRLLNLNKGLNEFSVPEIGKGIYMVKFNSEFGSKTVKLFNF